MLNDNSRTKNTIFNLNATIISMLVTKILGFVSRTIFIYILDVSYLGINGLYSNLLSMLSLAELGVGTAITYSLYKPLAERDIAKVSALMSFYRKAYMIIGLVIGSVGLILLLFLEKLVSGVTAVEHYQLYYILFLFNTVSSYFLAYKETIVSTDQKGYLLVSRNLFFQVFTSVGQLIVLAITKNYAAYLIVQIVIQTIRKIVVNIYITKLYSVVDFHSKIKVPRNDLQDIKKNVKAMLLQKIGGYVVYGTDNLLIASFVDLTTVGIYSNYTMIVDIIFSLISSVFTAMGASVGNLTATDKRQEYKIYKEAYFVNYLFASFTSICLFLMLNPFITIWIGDDYLLKTSVVFIVVLNYYMTTMRKSTEVFYNANGLFWHSRYKSLVEALINLGVSILLAQKLGILGILIGTSISSICTSVFYDVYVLFKYGFRASGKEFIRTYVIKYMLYLGITIVTGAGCVGISRLIGYGNIFSLILNGLAFFLIFSIVNSVLWGKIEEYQALKLRMTGIVGGIVRHFHK